MKIKERAIEEIQELSPQEVTSVYNLILALKKERPNHRTEERVAPYKRAREILAKCEGSLAEDIMQERKDRISNGERERRNGR